MKIPRLVSLLSCLLVAAVTALAAERPNILFIITDDQYKEMMSWLPEGEGLAFTPNTDKLAREGMIMLQQYVTSPVCTPSRFSCLTGKYPSRSRSPKFTRTTRNSGGQTVVQWNAFIGEDMVSLPRYLKKAGYRTGFVGKNHVYDVDGLKKPGWNDDPSDPKVLAILAENRDRHVDALQGFGYDFAASLYFNNPNENGLKALASHNLDWVVKGAFDFFDSVGENEPFFLWFATTVPHGPTQPDRSWNADPRITADGLLDEPLEVMPARSTIPERLKEAGITGGKKKAWHENALWLDDAVGALVRKLEENGQLDNTVIFYFNDHGQLSKGTVYQGGVHGESFVWRKGGWPGGNTSTVRVSNIDFTPTILDLAGLVPEKGFEPYFDGRSFLPVLMGSTDPVHAALYFEMGYVRGILKDNWKYIALRYPEDAVNMPLEERQRVLDDFNEKQKKKGRPVHSTDPMAAFSHISLIPGGGDAEHLSMGKYPFYYAEDQLYNLDDDPNEQKSLAGAEGYAEKLSEMKQELSKVVQALPGTFGEFGGLGE